MQSSEWLDELITSAISSSVRTSERPSEHRSSRSPGRMVQLARLKRVPRPVSARTTMFSLGVEASLSTGDRPRIDQRLDERIVLAQLIETGVPEQVPPRVPRVEQDDNITVKQHGR